MTLCTISDANALARAIGMQPEGPARLVPGGADCTTFRLACADVGIVALRVLPRARAHQLSYESYVMSRAIAAGMPVPPIYGQAEVGAYSVLAVGWVAGRTVAAEILRRPESAEAIGNLFGQVQARLHSVAHVDMPPSPWAAARTPEEEAALARALADGARHDALLHLDFHPLNVLTDGQRTTGMIDWANAGCGDPRQDVARTCAILRLETPRQAQTAVRRFVRGWRAGYEGCAGPLLHLAPFMAWAGLRMARDLAPRGDAPKLARIGGFGRAWLWIAGPTPEGKTDPVD